MRNSYALLFYTILPDIGQPACRIMTSPAVSTRLSLAYDPDIIFMGAPFVGLGFACTKPRIMYSAPL
jgi:hypothetical protein